ncbi:DUF6132 family protein [Bacteroides fragilis]|uniref:DUF6132 family protein n=1 Tax=Bacteroides fragilis TaxID=817 RepID=UPI001C7076CE|nr:DUF6132 family protein [Bacteroides fragilis]MBW9277001.1 hypothetical protein [Bacteroides fragilis]
MIKTFFKKNWLTFVGLGIGAIGGFLYWKYVGCTSGTCPITSSPVNSTLWGAVMGGLLLNLFKTDSTSKKTN